MNMCSLSCGLCQPTNDTAEFDPDLIDLFEAFFGTLPGSQKPELFDFQAKSAHQDKTDNVPDESVQAEEKENTLGLDNEIFGISQGW